MSQLDANVYYVPHSSRWPIIAVIGMFLFMAGAAIWLNGYDGPGQIVLTIGALSAVPQMLSLTVRRRLEVALRDDEASVTAAWCLAFCVGAVSFRLFRVLLLRLFLPGLFFLPPVRATNGTTRCKPSARPA